MSTTMTQFVADALSPAPALPSHFTGKERDTESGNDYMFARYYNSATGRFLSPDWSAKEDPVPYAKLDNPQTLNLYAYVRNNPMELVDTDGHEIKAASPELQASLDHLMESQEFRDEVAPYQGKGSPDLIIQRGENGKDSMEPDRQVLGNTDVTFAPASKYYTTATDYKDIPAKVVGATITIDNSVGKKDLDKVLAHEGRHAGRGARDPQGEHDEQEREKGLLHDKRHRESDADDFSGRVVKQVKKADKDKEKQQ